MKSFDYFATFEESVGLAKALSEQGLKIIAEPHLADEPKAPVFEIMTPELASLLKKAPAFYLEGAFTRFPLQFFQLAQGPASGKYSIDPLAQGPVISGVLSRVTTVSGDQRLLPGSYAYQDAYRNPETNAWEDASTALKAAFRQIVHLIKSRCPRFRYSPRTDIFIGPDALALLQAGKVDIVRDQIVSNKSS